MTEASPLNKVAEFHRTFKHPVQTEPAIPSRQRCDLRISLLQEEMKELEAAVSENNLVEVADALCDIQYVLAGAILEFGLGDKFQQLFDEVHRSNMSKACSSVEEANATVKHYKAKDDSDAYWKEEAGSYLVYREKDNKTLKSVNYSPADLTTIL